MKIGIDISSAQGVLTLAHWETIAKTNSFAIIECYIGNDGKSSGYETYLDAAKSVGMQTLPYNFLYPLPTDQAHPNRDPINQAKLHFNACNSIACADLEYPAPSDWQKWNISASFIIDWTNQYMETYKSLSGQYPILYTYPDFMMHVGQPASFAQYKLWIASYQSDHPDVPAPWTKDGYVLWQNTGGGLILPNGAKCDTDICIDMSIFTESAPQPAPPLPIPTPTPISNIVPAPLPAPLPKPLPHAFWWEWLASLFR